MLRVGLTGELGSGKSTVARLLVQRGAVVLSSDETARALMQPGQPVCAAIAEHFGPGVVLSGGELDRRALAAIAFDPAHPRIEELNALVHPPVIAEQERQLDKLARERPDAIAVIESALIFTTRHAGSDEPWRRRFDRILLVTAPDELKIARYVQRFSRGAALGEAERSSLRSDARRRLAFQRIPAEAVRDCILIENAGGLQVLEEAVETVWRTLTSETQSHTQNRPL